jgi:hypothetical protein
MISPKFGRRLESEIAEILRDAPYDDEPTRAVNRLRKKPGEPAVKVGSRGKASADD